MLFYFSKRSGFVNRYMISFIAFDFVLRSIRRSMVGIPFPVKIGFVNTDNYS